MKLTSTQLKRIIEEEVRNVRGKNKSRRLSESFPLGGYASTETIETVKAAFDALRLEVERTALGEGMDEEEAADAGLAAAEEAFREYMEGARATSL